MIKYIKDMDKYIEQLKKKCDKFKSEYTKTKEDKLNEKYSDYCFTKWLTLEQIVDDLVCIRERK